MAGDVLVKVLYSENFIFQHVFHYIQSGGIAEKRQQPKCIKQQQTDIEKAAEMGELLSAAAWPPDSCDTESAAHASGHTLYWQFPCSINLILVVFSIYALDSATSTCIPPNAIRPFTRKDVKKLRCPDIRNPEKGKIMIKQSKSGS